MVVVRSSCSSSTLPYVSTLTEKMDTPSPVESTSQTRNSFNEVQSNDVASNSAQQDYREPYLLDHKGKVQTSLILRAERISSKCNVPALLLLLVGSLFCGSIIANQSLKSKIAEMEKMREHLKETQASINAQIKRNQRQFNQEMFQKFNPHDREVLEEKVVKLTNNLKRLEEILVEERELINQAKYDRDVLSKKLHTLEQGKESKEKELISAVRTMSRLQAIDE
jgi:hypothetical protein